jgi:predicted phosphodiesterase
MRLLALLLTVYCLTAGCFPTGGFEQIGHVKHSAPWKNKLFETGPYLLHLGGSTFAVVLKARLPRPPEIEWWLQGEKDDQHKRVTAQEHDDLWVARLGPLPMGQRVSYQVRSSSGSSEVYTFKAGEAADRPFRFVVYGDTRTNQNVHWSVIKTLAREHVDFAIHTGDLVDFGVQEKEWLRFFNIERPLIASHPLVATFGNHDRSTRGYYRRFMLMNMVEDGRRYFSRDWGRIRMVVMDYEEEYRDGSSQYAFIEQRLAEAVQREMFIVLVIHEPPYSSGQHGSNLKVREVVRGLAARFGVELVVSGHDHNYERIKPIDGVTHVVSGSAGAPIRAVSPRSFSAAVRLEPHYVLVDVDERGLTLRAVNLSGATFDSFVIKPNPPGTLR